jgi:RHS repeat-associated protein
MQLASGSHIPDGLPAAGLLLSEKPRHGVASRNPAPHPGIDERNSTLVIGLRASLALDAVRQSERARYYASNDARFLTPDWSSVPEAVPYANLQNPQSLNLYDYVGDNPLGGIDANGHCWGWLQWFCNAGKAVGHAFVRAYQWDSRPRQKATVTAEQTWWEPVSSGTSKSRQSAGKKASAQCISEFYKSPVGRATNVFSLGGPLWGPNRMTSLKQWGEALTVKGGGGKLAVRAFNRFDKQSLVSLSGEVVFESSKDNGPAYASGTAFGLDTGLHAIAKSGTVTMIYATGFDVLAHAACYNLGFQTAGTETPIMYGSF